MNSIRQRRAFGLIVGSIALVISPSLGDPARAVTITGNTYASQNGGTAPILASNSYNQTNLSSVSASIRSDTTVGSHATSSASAYVDSLGVHKTTSGRAWTDVTVPTTLDNPRGYAWNASATGTTIVANYTNPTNPSNPPTATFQFFLPASILKTNDPFYYDASGNPVINPPLPGYADPTAMLLPVSGSGATQTVAQGVIGNGVGTLGAPNPLPTFSDLFVTVQANAQFGSTTAPLFNGSYEFNPSTGQFTPFNDFSTNNSVAPVINTQTSDANKPQYSLGFAHDISGGTFDAPIGQNFTVNIELGVSMGDPNNPSTFDFSSSSSHAGVIGGGGSVTGSFLLLQPSFFTVSAVPEPSTLCLAAVAGIGLMACLRSRRSRLISPE